MMTTNKDKYEGDFQCILSYDKLSLTIKFALVLAHGDCSWQWFPITCWNKHGHSDSAGQQESTAPTLYQCSLQFHHYKACYRQLSFAWSDSFYGWWWYCGELLLINLNPNHKYAEGKKISGWKYKLIKLNIKNILVSTFGPLWNFMGCLLNVVE